LLQDTILQPQLHPVDTGGFTEHRFALCSLLGIEFMPRIKDLADQQLYHLDRDSHYGEWDAWFRGAVDGDRIRSTIGSDGAPAVALKNRHAPPEVVVVPRLARASLADRLPEALTAYGRNHQSHLHSAVHPRRTSATQRPTSVEPGRDRHTLDKWRFFTNRGEFRMST
jgi:TnpA family transposase